MKRSVLSVLVCLVMVIALLPATALAENYDLFVGGVRVTSENASNITGTGIESGTASYDAATNTLTLNNAKVTGHYGNKAISTNYGGLTVKLVGDNEVIGQYNDGNSNYGFYIYGDLTFTGTGSLKVSAADTSNSNSWSVAVLATGSIKVEAGCTITATSGTTIKVSAPFCLYGDSSTKLETVNAKITASESASGTPTVAYHQGDLRTYRYMKIEPATVSSVTVNNGSGSGSYVEGAAVTIEADTPATGKTFKEWTGADNLTFTSGSKNSSKATFTMPAQAVTVTATYEDVPATPTPIPSTPTPNAATPTPNAATPEPNPAPETGDHSHMALWGALILIAFVGIVILPKRSTER